MGSHLKEYLFSAIVLLSGVQACLAGTIHVSPEGSDSGNGSADAPLRTLAKAAALAQPGDTVLIGDGIYRETLAPVRSGKPGAPITFKARPGTQPVVTGCDVIEGWKKGRGGRWKANVDWDLGPGMNQLFLNDKPLTEARHPNKTSEGIMEHDLEPLRFPEKGVARGAAFASRKKNQWAGAYFFGHGYEAWAYQCARIQSSYEDVLVFDSKTQSDPWFEKPMQHGDPNRLKIGEGAGFIFGLPICLDAPGEWFWKEDTVWLIPPENLKRDPFTTEARRRSQVVNIKDKNHIVLRGLKLTAGTLRIKGDHNVLEDCEGSYLAHFMHYTDGYAIDGGNQNGTAVEVDGDGNVVRGCRFAKTAASGIGLRGRDNLVTRCRIEETDYAGTYGACINIGGIKQRIILNTLRSAGRDCLQINGNTRDSKGGHQILLNDISLPGLVCRDVGIIYFFGVNGKAADGTDTRIAYNWVHDNPHPTPAPGIYIDNYVRNFQVDHNVVWNVPYDAPIRINAPSDSNRIFNNTVFRSKHIGAHTYNAFPRYNPDPSFWTNGEIFDVTLVNNLDLKNDPGSQLVNPGERDFTLKPGSASIGAGEPVEGIDPQPDLGAYQSGRPVWIPGHEGLVDPALLPNENLENVQLEM